MKKLFDKIKKNNKGFTLVELIVVIAVLAIITVVAAPQYIKYVEKSKIGTDENAIGEIAHIAEIQWVELEANKTTDTVDDEIVVTVVTDSTTGKVHFAVAATGNGAELDQAVSPMIGKYEVKSDNYKALPADTLKIKITNGVADWSPYVKPAS